MKKIGLCALLMFCLCTTLVAAQYTVSGPASVAVDACTYTTYTLQITNTGPGIIKPTIALEANNVANEWIIYDPRSPFVEPGATQLITVFVRAPCRTKGNFDVTFQIVDVNEPVEFKQVIEVRRTSNIAVSAPVQGLSSCPCQPQAFDFSIQNTASYPDVYNVKVKGEGAKYVTVVPNRDILFSGQSVDGTIFVHTPCEVYGNIDFELQVESENAGYRVDVPFRYRVDACYDYAIRAPQQVQACLDGNTQVGLTITNEIYFQNDYVLSASPSWARIEGDAISLFPTQTGAITLLLEPRSGLFGQVPGWYDVIVHAKSKKGDTRLDVSLPVEVQACYDIELTGPQEATLCPGDNHIPLTLTNYGSTDEYITLGIDGPYFIELAPAFVNVSSLSQQEINISAFISNVSDGVYPVRVVAELNDNILISDDIELDIRTVDDTACYKVSFSPDTFVLESGEQTHTVDMTNDGARTAVYELVFNGTPWMQLEQREVTLDPGQSQTISIVTTTTDQDRGTFPATLVAVTQQVAYIKTLTFKTPLNIWKIIIFILIILIIIILLILLLRLLRRKKSKAVVEKKKESKKERKTKSREEKVVDELVSRKKRRNWWWILWVVLFLLILLLGPIYCSLANPNRSTDINSVDDVSNIEHFVLHEPGVVLINFSSPVNLDNQTEIMDDHIRLERNFIAINTDVLQGLQEPATIIFYNVPFTNPLILQDGEPCPEDTCTRYSYNNNRLIFGITEFSRNYSVAEAPDEIEASGDQGTTETDAGQGYGGDEEVPTEVILPPIASSLTQRQVDILRLQQTLEAVPQDLKDTILYQIIDEGGSVTLDLAENFADPDNEELFFTTFSVPNITIQIDDGVATITPDDTFIGVRYTVFFARDVSGATAQTPVVNIIVVPTNLTQEAQRIRATIDDIDSIDQQYAQQYPQLRPTMDVTTRAVILSAVMLVLLIVFVGIAYGLSLRK